MWHKNQIALKIPFLDSPQRVKKQLKSSQIIRIIYISELETDSASWTAISKGITKNKSICELRFHSISITHNNIEYIINIIRGNHRIEYIRFDHWFIEQTCFADLCRAIKEMPKLVEIEISDDSLTREQLQILKSGLESSPRKILFSTFRDPVCSPKLLRALINIY